MVAHVSVSCALLPDARCLEVVAGCTAPQLRACDLDDRFAEVATFVPILASDRTANVTGVNYVIDGGLIKTT
ncbi:MAG: hypothetical protein JO156_16655 [Solirubrobacterales bacterium]|nr:hypothetical protein [Solirubrobacterales bacterium]